MKISTIRSETNYEISIREDSSGLIMIRLEEADGHKAVAYLTRTEVRELVEVLGPFHA